MSFSKAFSKSPGINLNSGTLSRCPQMVLKGLYAHTEQYEKNPSDALFMTWRNLWAVQKKVAAFFGADPHHMFFRANVTCAMNDFLLGVQLAPGAIVVSDLEYGAIVNICQLRADRESRRLAVVNIKTGPDAYSSSDEVAADILRQIPTDAKLVMLSHIITGTGLILPIDKIGAELRRRGILFAVDGAHGPGGVHLDFRELQNVDFYGGNLHKWFMGPKGTGFGWAHPKVQDLMSPIAGSWTTSEEIFPHFKTFGDGDPFTLKMLLSHTQNFPSYYALSEAVDFWKKHGEKKILKYLAEIQEHAIEAVGEELKWPLLSPRRKSLRGPLVSFKLPKEIGAQGLDFMFGLWKKHKVQIAMPGVKGEPCLRLSPHIYVTEKEITKGIQILKKYAART